MGSLACVCSVYQLKIFSSEIGYAVLEQVMFCLGSSYFAGKKLLKPFFLFGCFLIEIFMKLDTTWLKRSKSSGYKVCCLMIDIKTGYMPI